MNEFIYAVVAVFAVSAISLIGIFTISVKKEILNKLIPLLVAFATGSLLGAAFFNILPEAIEEAGGGVMIYVLVGIMIFFILESYINWHHCHNESCQTHYQPVTYLNLIGDAFHNFIDGTLIAAAFLISIPTGFMTAFAIAMHEIPQEIGDFAILIHGGFSHKKALIFNFLSSITSFLGVLAIFLFAKKIEGLVPIILAIAGGGFIYIATADLIPEIHKEKNKKVIVIQSLTLLLGVFIIVLLSSLIPE
ncbi:ZIP family metal transporter [Candidatus Parcubacteria bacterium]|nr:ZIP family metal transporter [Candidatus Parcubacteria bacterium]